MAGQRERGHLKPGTGFHRNKPCHIAISCEWVLGTLPSPSRGGADFHQRHCHSASGWRHFPCVLLKSLFIDHSRSYKGRGGAVVCSPHRCPTPGPMSPLSPPTPLQRCLGLTEFLEADTLPAADLSGTHVPNRVASSDAAERPSLEVLDSPGSTWTQERFPGAPHPHPLGLPAPRLEAVLCPATPCHPPTWGASFQVKGSAGRLQRPWDRTHSQVSSAWLHAWPPVVWGG